MIVEWFLNIGHSSLPTKTVRLWNYYGSLAILICQQMQKDFGIILVY